ncbi:phosphonate C-P lyase system protein PhnH [Halopenitus persicus]|uniref:Alpha-D-ribose 1-methylphosphonate 5-triphosphate synthase subunit PhnH n=1 Tax=Halopenitus persicus TaxID=1048396 RepID=A0A1H3LJD9_9EURY|nr:phosphonate C-P lyase system protein PhnH [Halopenitus persicus]SDY64068.1 alpha-D-ribose 1-methylphosphonate 5-triphosphate synthase subunit PhnH [Halopenitus persicus]
MSIHDFDRVHDTQACYRALVDSTSHPGTIHEVTPSPADRTVLLTLVDEETALHTDDDAVRETLSDEGRYVAASLETADIIHVHGSTDGAITDASRGTLKEPSEGATVLYRVDTVSTPSDAATNVTVSGPGVPGERRVAVALPPAELVALVDAQSDYPRGIDAYVTDGTHLVAFPRSVNLTVEEVA